MQLYRAHTGTYAEKWSSLRQYHHPSLTKRADVVEIAFERETRFFHSRGLKNRRRASMTPKARFLKAENSVPRDWGLTERLYVQKTAQRTERSSHSALVGVHDLYLVFMMVEATCRSCRCSFAPSMRALSAAASTERMTALMASVRSSRAMTRSCSWEKT